MHFKTRTEHALAALREIERQASFSADIDLPANAPQQVRDALFERRLNHLVELFTADQIADAVKLEEGS